MIFRSRLGRPWLKSQPSAIFLFHFAEQRLLVGIFCSDPGSNCFSCLLNLLTCGMRPTCAR
jgi:hypothetical protein